MRSLGELAAKACVQDIGAGVGLGDLTGCGDGRLRCFLDYLGRSKECALEDPRVKAEADTVHRKIHLDIGALTRRLKM